ncbi:MAG: hypothetical protein HXL35_03495 [Prevotellaceae bacterium]|nr:hypothetical protein [Prevotellaceae bacterium]
MAVGLWACAHCSTAVSSVYDGRHTRCSTIAVRAADGRRTMTHSLLSCGCYMIKGYTLQHNLLRYSPLMYGLLARLV